MMKSPLLRNIDIQDVPLQRREALDPHTLARAAEIIRDVRGGGENILRAYAERFDGLSARDPLVLDRAALEDAYAATPAETRALLTRVAERIRRFAEAQRACWRDLTIEIPGGSAGHVVHPLRTAGCYAPGGRYPLISSLLMTVVTARVAGVETIWAASPNPAPLMRAAAFIAGADALLAVGGAPAIAALAYGIGPAPACDVIAGPGNRWVTAAKHCVSANVRIDMLAGPSELLILADESGDPALIAADLLAQSEHDADARPMLVCIGSSLIEAVERELTRQLETLPTRATAEAALANGFVVHVRDAEEALRLCEEIAPEHLELHVRDADRLAERIRNCGCLFIGSRSAETLGDYSAGPNHTLPTGGAARGTSGLSVYNFLRQHTWIRIDSAAGANALYYEAAALAHMEGLLAHASSAVMRIQSE